MSQKRPFIRHSFNALARVTPFEFRDKPDICKSVFRLSVCDLIQYQCDRRADGGQQVDRRTSLLQYSLPCYRACKMRLRFSFFPHQETHAPVDSQRHCDSPLLSSNLKPKRTWRLGFPIGLVFAADRLKRRQRIASLNNADCCRLRNCSSDCSTDA